MSTLTSVFILGIFSLCIWKIGTVKSVTSIRSDYLSIESCNNVRGIAAIIILVHHLSQELTSGVILGSFIRAGYLAVALFFFFSGYGLQKRYMQSPETYANKFLSKRFNKILIPYIVIFVFYCLVYVLNGDMEIIKERLELLKYGGLLVPYSWYVIVCLVFYLFYYFLMIICKEKYKIMILLSFGFCIAELCLCKLCHFNNWWYNTIHLIPVGMIWAVYEVRIVEFVKKFYFVLSPVLIVVFSSTYHIVKSNVGEQMTIMCMISSLMFVLLIVFALMKVKIGNSILNWIGKNSFEVYLMQGFLIYIFRNERIYINNNLLYIVLVVLSTLICAEIAHKCFSLIYKNINKSDV